MKLVAGLGSIEEYDAYAKAGADELFCGYVPAFWSEKYGVLRPANRREVRYVNVQVGAFEELRILAEKKAKTGVPVTLAFNALTYSGEQYKELGEIISGCMEIGFSSYIIADPALLVYLRQQGLNCKIHLSGEMAEVNSLFLKEFAAFDLQRVIFHRKNSPAEMKEIIGRLAGQIPEYEAFFLNEMCHFTGAFCNSLHCDELCHMCHVPSRLGRMDISREASLTAAEPKINPAAEEYLPGETGCGLCALWKLRESGVTHLKIVGRGNYIDDMRRDIESAKRALSILEESADEAAYLEEMRRELFPKGCSENCYYR